MCFYYALSQNAQSLANRYQARFDPGDQSLPGLLREPIYYASGFDFPQLPVITNTAPERLQRFSWGLIPFWVKDRTAALELRSQTLNARSESVFLKPAFRNAIRQRRCLVPADGFYEWRLFNGKKYPYFVYLQSRAVFSFAGLWEEWTDKTTGEVVQSFSILTTEANPLLAKIHNTKLRMPVILPQSAEQQWLDSSLGEAGITALTGPLAEGLMAAHPISRLITSRSADRNVAGVQEAFDYPELVGI